MIEGDVYKFNHITLRSKDDENENLLSLSKNAVP